MWQILLTSFSLVSLLLVREGISQVCYGQPNCLEGTEVTDVPGPTVKDCCIGTDSGQSYSDVPGSCTTTQCIVHGFQLTYYSVNESESIDVTFEPNVKGETTASRLSILGTISTEEATITTTSSDFRRISGSSLIDNRLTVELTSLNDDLTLEYDERVNLVFTPQRPGTIENFEMRGEFIRHITTVEIMDNDRLEINFRDLNYPVKEGGGDLSVSTELLFREVESDFTLILKPSHLMDASGLGLPAIAITNATIATPGKDYNDMTRNITITALANRRDYTIEDSVQVFDDFIDEVEQSFALIAELGPDVSDRYACFQRKENEDTCLGRRGATRISITDNDEMVIGFVERSTTVSEGFTGPFDDVFEIPIGVSSLIISEREYNVSFVVQDSDETIIVVGTNDVTLGFDAQFGVVEENSITADHILQIGEKDIVDELRVGIRNDLNPENTECFSLRIISTDIAGERFIFDCNDESESTPGFFCEHEICIIDDDEPFAVGFVKTMYTVVESDGAVEVCVNLTRPMRDILDERVRVEVFNNESSIYIPLDAVIATPDEFDDFDGIYPMLPLTDYEEQIIGINRIRDMVISEVTSRVVCYNQSIYDDLRLEKMEYAGLGLAVRNSTVDRVDIQKPFHNTAIQIIDNDVAVVGLEETFYQVSETDGVVVVCVVVYEPDITCPIEFPFDVRLFTTDGSAVSPMDYDDLSTIVTFGECDSRQCVTITIEDDEVLENVESFFVNLSRSPGLDSRITLNPVIAEVQITDNDDAVVGLERTLYEVTEDVGVVEVCAIVYSPNGNINCSIDFPFEVFLSTTEGSAVSPMDYGTVAASLIFEVCETRRCVNISIEDDMTLENIESFNVILERSPGLDSRIRLDPVIGVVRIIDNDRAVVGLERTFYRVFESDGSVDVCTTVFQPDSSVDCPIAFPFTIDFFATDDSAVTPEDYVDRDVVLNFAACDRTVCVIVPIVNDIVLEDVERFDVAIRPPAGGLDSRITLDPTDGIVEIIDDGDAVVGLERTLYSVTEGEDLAVEVCAVVFRPGMNVACPITFPFEVSLSTGDLSAVAGMDYGAVIDEILRFSACQRKQCVRIPILEDSVPEGVKYFNVTLERTPGLDPRITLNPVDGLICIIDVTPTPSGLMVNDTLTGDPLMTVPIFSDPDVMEGDIITSLCYEVHGEEDKFFNLVSDTCVSVNSHYSKAVTDSPNINLNIVDAIGVQAVTRTTNECVNIQVDLENCRVTVDGVEITGTYRRDGITVRQFPNRVRISVPNCDNTDLVMWVFCTSGRTEDPLTWEYFEFDFIRFVVMRGLNLAEESHGLIGQFWNVPIEVTENPGDFNNNIRDDDYIITVPGSPPRSFVGLHSSVTWEFERRPCLYVGNSQAGPLGEDVVPNDSVIEGIYNDYEVSSMFSPNFVFSHFEEERCN